VIPASVVIRLEVQHVDPSIWRVLRVPADLRLADLHHVLQTVMGWRDCHAHAFQIQSCASTIDEDVTIAAALMPPHRAFTYIYDVGGEWRVSIARASGVWRGRTKSDIMCLDGYLAGPRDDGGGPAAYSAILAATLGDGPGLTEAQTKWVGPNFDPERFDRCAVNRALATLQPAL
jgi:hypothetical protein